jgi:dTDP-4-dehydrorhamnose reductase
MPAIWGGMECTINRVQDQYYDQFERTGQYSQTGDLQKICDLGITRLRFPVLWERHHNNPAAWKHTTSQLEILAANAVEPIAGLLHHGSGPAFTNLADPAFPQLFAKYAAEVASTFPHIKYYTPVNEPLTTARFSGLYGYWYPHAQDETTFAIIFLNQLKAIVLAMQAIRKINPAAELIQTEDLCKIHSTRSLQYQADFENGRRWWTYDFLMGKVTPSHKAWNYFTGLNIPVDDLLFFSKNSCPPAVAGFNYYATSERYLDHHTERYPHYLVGGNGRETYADTEAVRSGHAEGLKTLLTEAWDRYHLPMAVTECHLSCTREQQLRWFDQQWNAATELHEEAVPVVAVTAWSLAGAYDWNSLVTQKTDHYESGAFRMQNGSMMPTALADMIRVLSTGSEYTHPVLPGKGWWNADHYIAADTRPLIIVASPVLREYCAHRGLDFIEIKDPSTLQETIAIHDAWAVVAEATTPTLKAICLEMNISFVCIRDNDKINEALDHLIDQQTPGEYSILKNRRQYVELPVEE